MTTLIIGCGATGLRVAARAVAAGEYVVGVVRSFESAPRVRAVGARALCVDFDHEQPALPSCQRLIYSLPPPRQGSEDTRLSRVLACLPAKPEYIVYLGTSGVYGDCQGAWVDETRPPAPDTERPQRRLSAEKQMRQWASQAVLLRIAGIYGPGRLGAERVMAGYPILAETDSGWSNRIHIDDLANIVWLLAQCQPRHRLYNVSDGYPVKQAWLAKALADGLGVAMPPSISWDEARRQFSSIRLSFLSASRRLSNRRLLTDMGYQLLYHDYRQGIAASLEAEQSEKSG